MDGITPGPRCPPPIADEIRRCWAQEARSYHMPGHKGGHGADALAVEIIGAAALRADLSELSGFDYLHAPNGAVAHAQRNAAQLFGARQSHFLVNGATVGNIAAILATVGDGERILMFRGSHRSVYAGVTLAGAIPVYIEALHDNRHDLATTGDIASARAALQRGTSINAIHVTRPNYYGFCCDLAPYVALAREHGIPLIVDEAHGTHFAFHPALPQSALDAGADIVIQSPHKTLSSLTQSSLLHVGTARVDTQRLSQALGMLQSSSPSALLLLSLDIALAQMARNGTSLWGKTVALANDARRRINRICGLRCYDEADLARSGIAAYDPAKLVIDFSALGLSGFAARGWLREHRKINPEFADLRRVVCSLTVGDDALSTDALIAGLEALHQQHGPVRAPRPAPAIGAYCSPAVAMTPRQAGAGNTAVVAIHQAAGHIAAEFVIPYPPGIPLLVPGEVIDDTVLSVISTLRDAGCSIVGTADASVSTLRVLHKA